MGSRPGEQGGDGHDLGPRSQDGAGHDDCFERGWGQTLVLRHWYQRDSRGRNPLLQPLGMRLPLETEQLHMKKMISAINRWCPALAWCST